MSQVIRKYASGGATEKPKLFSVSGLGDFDQKTLIEQGYRNIDEYIASKGLKGDMASNFKNAVQHMLEGIGNGTFSMDAMGNYKDKTGQASSTGEIDRKKFLGIKTGIKNTDNNAYGIAADYIHKLILDSPKYNHPETKSKKFNANEFLAKEISKRWYGGNNIDFNNWFKNRAESDRNALMGEIFNTADYNKLYQDYDWTDTGVNSAEDLANRFKGFSSAIINNKLDNDDYNRFAELGGSGLDKFMKETQESQETTPEQNKTKVWEEEAKVAGASSPEAISAYVQKKKLEEEARDKAIIKNAEDAVYAKQRNDFFDNFKTNNPFKETIKSGYLPDSVNYNPDNIDNPVKDFYENDINGYLNDNLSRDWFKAGNTQHIANQLDYLINHLHYQLPDAGDGFVAIPSTFDYDRFSTVVYNPTTREYKETSMLANDALRKIADNYYNSTHPSKHKEGGVLYMQFGGTYNVASNYSSFKQSRDQERKEKEQQKAQSKGRTVEEQKIADRKPGSITSGDWTDEDKIILGSIVGDIASMGAAYIPVYGTIASAGLGMGSSLANYGAELSRNGFKWGDLGNLAVNLGLDTVGLVPGLGTAAKGSKILKTAAKYLPRVLATVSLANAPEVVNSVKKAMTPGTDLTVDDWRNIAEGFKMVLQGGKGIKRTVQAHNLKKELATGNKVLDVAGNKDRQVTLTPDEWKEITSHRKIEDQQAALQLLKKDDNLRLLGDLNKRWFNPTGWLPNSNVRNEYDFNKTKKVKTSNGVIEVPVVYSNSDKYIAATMQQNFVKVPGFDEMATKYNDWKYGVKKEKPTKKEPKKESKKESVSGATQSYKPEKPVDTSLRDRIDRNLGINNSPLTGTDVSSTAYNKVREKEYQNMFDDYDKNSLKKIRTATTAKNKREQKSLTEANKTETLQYWRENYPKETAGLNDEQLSRVIRDQMMESRTPSPNVDVKEVVASKTIQPTKRLDQFIEDQIPGGLVYGRARAKREREYSDVFHPVAEKEQNSMWSNFKATKQHDINQKKIAQADANRIRQRQIAEETKKSVDKQIALVQSKLKNTPISAKAHSERQKELNKVFIPEYMKTIDSAFKRELPHKKSNKKKKTSKDNNVKRREFGGLIFKDGGLIPKYLGGNVMQRGTRGTWLNNDNTFKDATNLGTWDTYYNINGIIDDITKSGVLSNSNADNWVSTANRLSSMDLPWKKQLNAKGYNDWNALYSSTGLNKYFGEDKDKFDYLGPSTWNRRLLLQTLGYKYNSPDNPLTVGTDKVWYDNGVWKKLPSTPKSTTPTQVTSQQSKVAPILEEVFSTGKPASAPDKTTRNVKTLPEDVLALGRMVSGLVTNNRAAKIYKEGLKPTLLDTFENYVPLQGNFQAKTSAERQAGNMESVAARPRTSDASLQLAGELEASDKANQARFQGDLQDAEMYYKTRMLGQQESDAAKARRVEVANKNRASMNAIDAAKKQIDAARVSANYQQVIAPWLAGIEHQFAQNRAANKQFYLENAQKEAERLYSPEFDRLTEKYNAALRAYGAAHNNDYSGWETSDEYKALLNERKALNNTVSQFLLSKKKSILDSPYLFQFDTSTKIPYSKSGSKLTIADRKELQRIKDFNKRISEDTKQFHKDIMESKREHNKLIVSMSSLTAELIKKAMS